MKFKLLNTALAGFILSISSFAQAGIIESAERFWAFDGSYNDSVGNIVGNSTGGALFGSDRDGNANGALLLDGVDDSVIVDVSTDLAVFSDYSLSLWFKLDQHNVAGRTYLFDSRAPGSTSFSYIFIDRINSSSESLYSFNNSTIHSTLDDQNWHNIIITNSNSNGNAKTYLDGIQISESGSLGAKNFNGGLTFGSYGLANAGGNYWLNGQLDDIGLWNKSLTVEEVAEVYNAKASATSVPEPSTLAIFALGMIGLASRRFKKQS